MNKITITLLLCLFAILNCQAQTPFQVLYPTGTSLTNAVVMSDYSDTANGKIVMNGWSSTSNLVINSFNISNNNYPCGSSAPYPASNTIYLNELYTGTGYALCYASGPMPDTIMYYLLDPVTSAARDTMYFVVGGSYPASLKSTERAGLTVSPNPAQDYISVSELSSEDELTIYSLNGTVLIKTSGTNSANRIDISTLPIGLYILELRNKKGVVKYEKFLKE